MYTKHKWESDISMLNSVNKHGGNAQLKICYGIDHEAWHIAYAGDELANWLLSHKREKHHLEEVSHDNN